MKAMPCQPTSMCLNTLLPARLLQHLHGQQFTRPRYEVCEISGLDGPNNGKRSFDIEGDNFAHGMATEESVVLVELGQLLF